MSRAIVVPMVAAAIVGCGGSPSTSAASPTPSAPGALTVTRGPAARDTSGGALIPPGYGSLKTDDISIILQPNGVRTTLIPLDESVIRVLAPDSYRNLHLIAEAQRAQIARRANVRGMRNPRVWLVTFTGLAPDARFVPTDVTITSGGRDYRPFDIIGLSPGFAEQRVQSRESQRGLLLFDDQVDVSQSLVVSIDNERNSDWGDAILQKIETERSAVRARASSRP